jgi:hypothetical protein
MTPRPIKAMILASDMSIVPGRAITRSALFTSRVERNLVDGPALDGG